MLRAAAQGLLSVRLDGQVWVRLPDVPRDGDVALRPVAKQMSNPPCLGHSTSSEAGQK